MLIDWFTVIAQAVNFLVLIWLLNRFLYKPVLKAVNTREEKIRSQLQEAEQAKSLAEQEKEAFQEKNEAFEEEHKTLLNNATEEARTLHHELVEKAREDVAKLRSRLEASLKEEQETLSREIREHTHREVIEIARKVLADLATVDLEAHMVKVFISQCKQLDNKQRSELAGALAASEGEVLIRSAFELDADQRAGIKAALQEIRPEELHCHFEVAAEKISGIELTAAGHKMVWSVTGYLGSLEKKLAALIDEETEMHA